MKTLILMASILTVSAMADCGPSTATGKTLYPISKEAQIVAQETGLKTCNRSIRFAQTFKAKYSKQFKALTFEEYKKALGL